MNKFDWIDSQLRELKESGLYNPIKTLKGPIGGTTKINSHKLINFCSNNYLGLAGDTRLKNAAIKAIKKYGVGPGSVRTISGTTELHHELEEKLAKFKKAESVVTFQSGFTANLATIPALVGKDDLIFSDELNHASIIDGCRLSKATVIRYKHNDPRDLETQIKHAKSKNRALIITDGVFSMDGDIVNLSALLTVADRYNIPLMVDDAHGEGVLGTNGRGIVDHFNLHGKVDIEVGTLSKAFGVIGGFVAANKKVTEWLTQRGRPFLFSSAMTIPDVAASTEAVKILSKDDKLVKKLWQNANYMKDNMKKLGFDVGKSDTPIVPMMLGEASLARNFSKELLKHGVFAMAIGYPTVPQGKARIRVMNSAVHTKDQLDSALEAFSHVGKKLNVIE